MFKSFNHAKVTPVKMCHRAKVTLHAKMRLCVKMTPCK